uniref:Uncharacterized protein n=1 Tax=Magnetococcus massalia (strain MO-1) TaxID=451514 RepID=A0A1S7LL57_MAGMO|nr:Protein of unknown function [Candidatus Magnetococcus massalia]
MMFRINRAPDQVYADGGAQSQLLCGGRRARKRVAAGSPDLPVVGYKRQPLMAQKPVIPADAQGLRLQSQARGLRLQAMVQSRGACQLTGLERIVLPHGAAMVAQVRFGLSSTPLSAAERENLRAVFHLPLGGLGQSVHYRMDLPKSHSIGEWRIRNGRIIRGGALRRRRSMPRRVPPSRGGVVEQQDGALGWLIVNEGTSLLLESQGWAQGDHELSPIQPDGLPQGVRQDPQGNL